MSYEPALGPVDFDLPRCPFNVNHDVEWNFDAHAPYCLECGGEAEYGRWFGYGGIDWLVAGGESGPGARVCELSWIREALWVCQEESVPFFVKQLGAAASDHENGLAGAALTVPPEALPLVSKRLRDRKGGDMAEWPEDMRVREYPREAT